MTTQDWVTLIAAELGGRGFDTTRTYAYGVPCNLLTAVRMPCHDEDRFREAVREVVRPYRLGYAAT